MRATMLLPVLMALIPSGCLHQPVSGVELASDFRQIASLARETKLFLQQLRAGKVPLRFAQVHTAYLQEEVNQAQRKLDSATAVGKLEQVRQACRDQQQLLAKELELISLRTDDPSALTQIEARLDRIAEDCAAARALL
jgi:hypothetical protein